MAVRQPRYSKEEFAQRGDALYESAVRSQVEEGNHGKIVAIDIETRSFERSCGAISGFSTQVSVLKSGEILPNQSGNLFIADTDRGKAPSGIGGGPEVRLSWTGLRAVRLIHYKNARVFLANPRFSEVSVVYDSFN